MIDSINTFDVNILLTLMEVRNGFCDAFFLFITHLGDGGAFWIALSVLLMCFKKTRSTGILCAFALVGSVVVNNAILKNVVARPRPFNFDERVICLLKDAKETVKDWSFPSGHTGSSFAAGTVIFLREKKRFGIPAVILAALIAFSRLYVAVHYPTDVFAAIITGVLIAVVCHSVGKQYDFSKFLPKKIEVEEAGKASKKSGKKEK